MLLRKINAVLSLLCTVLLLNHAVSHGVWMLFQVGLPQIPMGSYALMWLMGLHAVISIVMAFLGHRGAQKRKCNGYPQLNRPTLIQRASGILLIIGTALHVAGTLGYTQPPQIVHAVLPPLFFTVALVHTAVSAGKALVTLGIGNAKVFKAVDIAVKAVCAITLIADVVGFYIYAV